jgi:hypothetical protein
VGVDRNDGNFAEEFLCRHVKGVSVLIFYSFLSPR